MMRGDEGGRGKKFKSCEGNTNNLNTAILVDTVSESRHHEISAKNDWLWRQRLITGCGSQLYLQCLSLLGPYAPQGSRKLLT